jgi:hypothetical protein
MPQFQEYLAKRLSYMQRGQRHIQMFDARLAQLPPSDQRQVQAEWLKAHEQLVKQTLVGRAFVLNSPFLRLPLNALLRLSPGITPTIITPNLSEGASWLTERLWEEGLTSQANRIRAHYGLPPLSSTG